ncbi:MAG: hypothetical protein ACR2M3_15850 [Thermomicrobiales bacterium]
MATFFAHLWQIFRLSGSRRKQAPSSPHGSDSEEKRDDREVAAAWGDLNPEQAAQQEADQHGKPWNRYTGNQAMGRLSRRGLQRRGIIK